MEATPVTQPRQPELTENASMSRKSNTNPSPPPHLEPAYLIQKIELPAL